MARSDTHTPNPLATTRAHQLATGDEIVWIDGTSTTVRAAGDDKTTDVYLALSNGRNTFVRRTRRFAVLSRSTANTQTTSPDQVLLRSTRPRPTQPR